MHWYNNYSVSELKFDCIIINYYNNDNLPDQQESFAIVSHTHTHMHTQRNNYKYRALIINYKATCNLVNVLEEGELVSLLAERGAS